MLARFLSVSFFHSIIGALNQSGSYITAPSSLHSPGFLVPSHLCVFIAIFLFIPASSCPYLYIFIKSRLSFQFDPFFCDRVLVLIITGHFYQQYAPSECSVLSEVKGRNLHGLFFLSNISPKSKTQSCCLKMPVSNVRNRH